MATPPLPLPRFAEYLQEYKKREEEQKQLQATILKLQTNCQPTDVDRLLQLLEEHAENDSANNYLMEFIRECPLAFQPAATSHDVQPHPAVSAQTIPEDLQRQEQQRPPSGQTSPLIVDHSAASHSTLLEGLKRQAPQLSLSRQTSLPIVIHSATSSQTLLEDPQRQAQPTPPIVIYEDPQQNHPSRYSFRETQQRAGSMQNSESRAHAKLR